MYSCDLTVASKKRKREPLAWFNTERAKELANEAEEEE